MKLNKQKKVYKRDRKTHQPVANKTIKNKTAMSYSTILLNLLCVIATTILIITVNGQCLDDPYTSPFYKSVDVNAITGQLANK